MITSMVFKSKARDNFKLDIWVKLLKFLEAGISSRGLTNMVFSAVKVGGQISPSDWGRIIQSH